MPCDTKLYKVLNVAPTASASDIKKAYHKAARDFHPDRPDGNEAKFKEAQHAYEILGNAEKRAAYDSYGEAAFQPSNSGPDPFSNTGGSHGPRVFSFSMHRGGMGGMGSMGGMGMGGMGMGGMGMGGMGMGGMGGIDLAAMLSSLMGGGLGGDRTEGGMPRRTPSAELRPGSRVVAHGLKTAAINGATGVVVGAQDGRFTVDFGPSIGEKALRAENLRPVSRQGRGLIPGATVVAHGLQGCPELNDIPGVVVGPAANGRVEVHFEAPHGVKSLRPENLRVLD